MRTDIAAFDLLQGALKAAQLRQQVYANNIANADTPGYKRQDVVFESLLQSQLGLQSGQQGNVNWGSVAQIQPQVVQDNTSAISNNGNNVSINNEMTKLAENQIRYNALIEDMKLRFTRTQKAIGG
jgi:flagellar basal-body rod protein FlgB